MHSGDRLAGGAGPKPPWLKRDALKEGSHRRAVEKELKAGGLETVCRHSGCPNLAECYGRGTATFLILGPVCTRACSFCRILPGVPAEPPADEAERVAAAAGHLGLSHVVVTSVTRDDLPDGGAVAFAAVTAALRRRLPAASVELLVPDFGGSREAQDSVLAARPDVLGHNLETVPRLYPAVRPGAGYGRSLELLRRAGKATPDTMATTTKSGLMLGLGETVEEVEAVLTDLSAAAVDHLTIGQYIPPSSSHHPVARWVEPTEFEEWGEKARDMGFSRVQSGPLVRSSYRAGG